MKTAGGRQSGTLTILGASARAAVQSARRADFAAFAGDLFADADTCACAPAVRVSDYPGQLTDVAAQAPPGPWMFTGGLENHPELVDAIAAVKPLWGCGGETLRRIRDPFAVAAVLKEAGLPALEVAQWKGDLAQSGSWLDKPLASCGGIGIVLRSGISENSAQFAPLATSATSVRPRYLQRYIRGTPAAAIFVAGDGEADLLGVTQQLIGVGWLGAAGFQYCGSIGPLVLPPPLVLQLRAIGHLLSDQFGLCGLFGVDGVISDRRFWTVEVNPRYTASVEILERAGCAPTVALHAAAFGEQSPPPLAIANEGGPAPTPRLHGKAIVYATADVVVGRNFLQWVDELNANAGDPLVADIPREKSPIFTGHPIATIFASGLSAEAVVKSLQTRTQQLYATLAPRRC